MGKVMTDAEIRAALRNIKKGEKTAITLTDAAPRGAARLVLIVKPERAEWYGQRYVDGKRRLEKIGSIPDMTLAQARESLDGVAKKPSGRASSDGATLRAMFDGYLQSLRDAGKPSATHAGRLLDKACAVIGGSKMARDVTPADIVRAIRPIFERGARVQADKMRMYVGAAFRWAMQATHDYRVERPVDWGLRANPITAVPRDTTAEGIGDRRLDAHELAALIRWCRTKRGKSHKALLLLALTGQRVREIVELRACQWDSRERILSWASTKTGVPHLIPVCQEAADVLDSLRAGQDGYLFPGRGWRPLRDAAVLKITKQYAAANRLPPFTGRDMRRTWKTLAGVAGLTKQERDWLQNHAQGDVSSVHYDRYEYLREKRAAVEKWEAWIGEQVGGSPAESPAT